MVASTEPKMVAYWEQSMAGSLDATRAASRVLRKADCWDACWAASTDETMVASMASKMAVSKDTSWAGSMVAVSV